MMTLYHIVEVCNFFCTFTLMMYYRITGILLAHFVISRYDGTRGFIHSMLAKYGFYTIYPIHIIVLVFFLL